MASRILSRVVFNTLAAAASASVSRAGSAALRARMTAPRMSDSGLGGAEVTVLGGGFGGLCARARTQPNPIATHDRCHVCTHITPLGTARQ